VDRVPKLQRIGGHFKQYLRNKLVEHKEYIRVHGEDLPEIQKWKWEY
jgi:xylulose-5-phosphate/fructose-6-phosphate phosphoketolase